MKQRKVPPIYQVLITACILFTVIEMFMECYYTSSSVGRHGAFFELVIDSDLGVLVMLCTVAASIAGILGIWMNRPILSVIPTALFSVNYLAALVFHAGYGIVRYRNHFYLVLLGITLLIVFVIVMFYNLNSHQGPKSTSESNSCINVLKPWINADSNNQTSPIQSPTNEEQASPAPELESKPEPEPVVELKKTVGLDQGNSAKQFCTHCGNILQPDALFCAYCGTRRQ